MRTINEIIIHCADTPEGRDNTVADITAWHKARGFRTIGYHYVIYRDGSIHTGRPVQEIGAHCVGHNKHSIGICYIGGKSADGKKHEDTRTPEQKKALLSLLRQLKAQYPNATVYGHRDFSSKPCPCFDAFREYKHLALAIMLVFSSLLFSSCRSTKRVVEEKADVSVRQAVSQSATSSTTDKFLQNIVLQIDSIVLTQLSVPQVSEANDSFLFAPACDNSGSEPCATSGRTNGSSAKASGAGGASLRSGAGSSLPRIVKSKIKVSGIRLQSTTADSRSTATAVSSDGNLQASDRSLAKDKEISKPSQSAKNWIYLIIFIAIAVAVIFALLRYRSAIWSVVRFVLRKVIT